MSAKKFSSDKKQVAKHSGSLKDNLQTTERQYNEKTFYFNRFHFGFIH